MENFNLKKYLTESKLLKEEIQVIVDDEDARLIGNSGEYDAWVEDDGTVSFSVIYEDEDDAIDQMYDETDIQDFLGQDHAFVELANKIPHRWDIESDIVGITVKVEDLKSI